MISVVNIARAFNYGIMGRVDIFLEITENDLFSLSSATYYIELVTFANYYDNDTKLIENSTLFGSCILIMLYPISSVS